MIQINKEEAVHKILDIDRNQVTDEFMDYIDNHLHYTYRDNTSLNENLYGNDIISEVEEWQSGEDWWTEEIKNTLQEISALCNEHDAAYWRIINQ